MTGQKTIRESARADNRMEPMGPNRYLGADLDIRKQIQLDRRIVSSMLIDSVLSVLRSEFDFDDEEIDSFRANLQKEIES